MVATPGQGAGQGVGQEAGQGVGQGEQGQHSSGLAHSKEREGVRQSLTNEHKQDRTSSGALSSAEPEVHRHTVPRTGTASSTHWA